MINSLKLLFTGRWKDMTNFEKKSIIFLMVYLTWLLAGTLFYAYAPRSNMGLIRGYYFAINVGYSIGWGFPKEPFVNYMVFSIVFCCIGASFIGVALGFFADRISEDHDNWFTNMVQKRDFDKAFAKTGSIPSKVKQVFVQYRPAVRAVAIWFAWIFIMSCYSTWSIPSWTWKDAYYFSITSCSTGGHWALPADSPASLYGVTAFFAMIGVPLMGVAMAAVGDLFSDSGDLDETKETINEEVSLEELQMLQKFNLENGDGVLDRTEFIILCMVRMGTDPNLVEYMTERFSELDADGGGTLSISEITGGEYFMYKGEVVPGDTLTEEQKAEIRANNARRDSVRMALIKNEAT